MVNREGVSQKGLITRNYVCKRRYGSFRKFERFSDVPSMRVIWHELELRRSGGDQTHIAHSVLCMDAG